MDVKEEFLEIVERTIKREGIKELMDWIQRTDFFTAPASTRYHGCYEGGLAVHSLNVHTELMKLCRWYRYQVTEESLAIVSLFHDICKINCYKVEMRWRKNEDNKWEQYATWKFDEDYSFGGHGSKSVYLIQNFMKLNPVEAAAINSHMGAWDATTYSNPSAVYEKNMLAWLLHVADEAANYVVEKRTSDE